MLPHVLLTAVTLGPILAGMATPTEAAGVGVVGTLIMAALYRTLDLERFKNAVIQTAQQSSMMLLLAVASNIFGAVFARLGSASLLTDTLARASPAAHGDLARRHAPDLPARLAVRVADARLRVRASAPARDHGPQFDPLWFAVLVAVNFQTTFLSPPVATAAYYLKAVAPDWTLTDIHWGMVEFMMLQLIGLLLVMLFPGIALWFPHWLYGK